MVFCKPINPMKIFILLICIDIKSNICVSGNVNMKINTKCVTLDNKFVIPFCTYKV